MQRPNFILTGLKTPHVNDNMVDGRRRICFDTSDTLATRLLQYSKQHGQTQGSTINSIISCYFDGMDAACFDYVCNDPRRDVRKKVFFRGVIETSPAARETRYQSVEFVDISLGGARVKVDETRASSLYVMNKQTKFTLIFCLPSFQDVFRIVCNPIHVSRGTPLEIGASFVAISADTMNSVKQYLQL